MRKACRKNTEENRPVLAKMRFSQVDGVSSVEFRAEPHGGIGFIKNLEIISISLSVRDIVMAHGCARWRKPVEAGSVTTRGRARWWEAVEACKRL